MIVVEPIPQVGRQEHRLVSVAAEEVLGHCPMFSLQTDENAEKRGDARVSIFRADTPIG